MTFDEWWERQSGWGGEHLAEYQLARKAYEFGRRQGCRDAEEDAKDAYSEGIWSERQGEEYGSY